MTAKCKILTAVLALAAVGVTADCNDPKPAPSGPTGSSSAPHTTTTTSVPATMSPAEKDLKDAEQSVARFWDVVDELAIDPKTSLDHLATVSRDKTIDQWRQILTNHRRQGWKQVGTTGVATSPAQALDEDKFTARACIDVSKVNLVDAAGKSVVAANRPPRVQYAYTVQKASDGKFYVIDDKTVQTC